MNNKDLLLPLVETLISNHRELDFSRVKIIGVQHILETTHAMFRSLYKLGLKPHNISLIGKCYSTCEEVFNEMIADGIDVSQGSFSYSSHTAFDDEFDMQINNFFSRHVEELQSSLYEHIIVLDDGGKCIQFFKQNLKSSIPIIGIEQTSSGYNVLKEREIFFPIINVARSPIKLKYESPLIADAAAERMFRSLEKRGLFFDKALIIGGGAIGKAMHDKLSLHSHIKIYDIDNNHSHLADSSLSEIINNYPLIIGCTGRTSIPHSLHSCFTNKTTLVSASSSDREFDAVYLRRKIPISYSCHEDLNVDNIFLIRSGFPVNFDGERENIDPELIQLTIALITAAILQAKTYTLDKAPGIIALDKRFEEQIIEQFLSLHKIK